MTAPHVGLVPLPVLERSLLKEVRHAHKLCGSFIFPDGHVDAGRCSNCSMQLKGGKTRHLKVLDKQKMTVFVYQLPDARFYVTYVGIWNRN